MVALRYPDLFAGALAAPDDVPALAADAAGSDGLALADAPAGGADQGDDGVLAVQGVMVPSP